MIALAIKLLLAHVIGDFVLQPDSWVKDKKEKTFRSPYFYLHGLIHFIALLFLLEFNMGYIMPIIIIVISHLIIDLVKLSLDNEKNSRRLFFMDQFAHLLVISLVVNYYREGEFGMVELFSTANLLFALAVFSVSIVSAILMRVIMSKWAMDDVRAEDALQNAGKYIGILERLFVFGFILVNQWSAIGFLITAKSVFRFGDLSRAKNRKLTEYILIGTLISFGLAIVIAMGYKYILALI